VHAAGGGRECKAGAQPLRDCLLMLMLREFQGHDIKCKEKELLLFFVF
jgi:hypothetical protein